MLSFIIKYDNQINASRSILTKPQIQNYIIGTMYTTDHNKNQINILETTLRIYLP